MLKQCTRLSESHPQTAELLRIFSLLAPCGIDLTTLVAGAHSLLFPPKQHIYQFERIKFPSSSDPLHPLRTKVTKTQHPFHKLLRTISSHIELHNLIRRLQEFSLIQIESVPDLAAAGLDIKHGIPQGRVLHVAHLPALVREILRGIHNGSERGGAFSDIAVCVIVTACIEYRRGQPHLTVPDIFSPHLLSLKSMDEPGQFDKHRARALDFALSQGVAQYHNYNPLPDFAFSQSVAHLNIHSPSL